jgi:hypothetical protein
MISGRSSSLNLTFGWGYRRGDRAGVQWDAWRRQKHHLPVEGDSTPQRRVFSGDWEIWVRTRNGLLVRRTKKSQFSWLG